jgi:DNA (cytosine-5)-methyltransferase 1
MKEGLIAQGVVDERSIKHVNPSDLRGFTQCHFFVGIGGWPLALRHHAGWPDDRPVWTGSCPCQSFSDAGKQLGFADPRHLWPCFKDLIAECRPATVFGEQVEAAVRRGSADQSWLDLVASDLGKIGYEFGSAVFPAASMGTPHLRERLYFVANSDGVQYSPDRPPRDSMVDNFWSDYEWVKCRDGKRRAVKPGLRTLIDGFPGQVALLRGAGNAIVPQQAAEFILAFVEARSEIASPLSLLR